MGRGTDSVKKTDIRVIRLSNKSRAAMMTMVLALPLAIAPAWAASTGDSPADKTLTEQSVQRMYQFDIPVKPLPEAIAELSAVTGLQVFYTEPATFKHTAPALRGRYTVHGALQHLLTGSGLTMRFTGNNSITIESANQSNVQMLPPVTVSAMAVQRTVTEGSGSYTTEAISSASKLPLSLRDTPQAATVITRQRMDDMGMVNVVDAIKSTPGLNVSLADGPGRPLFHARGFYVDNVMQDGLKAIWSSYMPTTQSNMAMYDRVEVVRGATGLMQGAGQPSASVNLVRKKPTKDFQGQVTAAAGSWDDYSGSIDFSGAINDSGSVRGRVVTSYRDSDSFRDDQAFENHLFYGIFEIDLTDNTLLSISASRQDDHTDGAWWGGIPISATGTHLDLDRSASLANDWEYLDQKTDSVYGSLEHRFNRDWSVTAKAMYTKQELDGLGTFIYTDTSQGVNRQHYTWRGVQELTTINYDVYVNGSFNFLDRKHEVVFGASRNDVDSEDPARYGTAYITSNVDVFNWDSSAIAKPNLPKLDGTSHNVTMQDSAYATTRLTVTDTLKVILGARLDWFDYDNRTGDGDYSVTRQLTKYAGVIYDISDAHSVYASYTDVFDPQSSVDIHGSVLKPIVGKNYELGLKGEYFGGSLNASAAIFRIDQENRSRLVDDVSLCETAASCYEASGKVRSEGVDLELQGALTPQLEVAVGYTYTDVEYVRDATYKSGTPFDTSTPEQLFKLTGMYKFNDALARWRVGGNVSWQSRIYEKDETNGLPWTIEQDDYALVNLIVGYQATEELDLQLNINNVFDKTYYQAIGYSTAWGPDTFGEPSSVHLTARYDF